MKRLVLQIGRFDLPARQYGHGAGVWCLWWVTPDVPPSGFSFFYNRDFSKLPANLFYMEKVIEVNAIKVAVSWEGRLVSGTEVCVHTGDPGLAMNIMQLFLDDMGKRHLWYESSWLTYPGYQEMTLTESGKEVWENWSRDQVLFKTQHSIENKS